MRDVTLVNISIRATFGKARFADGRMAADCRIFGAGPTDKSTPFVTMPAAHPRASSAYHYSIRPAARHEAQEVPAAILA